MNDRISVVEGNITDQNVDALVNAANSQLHRGGGVDGAIHAAAGPQLQQECTSLHGCEVGQAKISKGYKLPAQWVIHTVGPFWEGGDNNEDELLANCYRNSLALAVEKGIKTIAFPAISTGVYGFPLERAIEIALTETKNFLAKESKIEKVIFVCFGIRAYESYQAAVRRILD